ncbi:MAG: hypothetical protein KDK78_00345 [Chlamydiia bacterium]|nr:hypothetical protein [Chlamydiia bacterium]
MRVNEMARGGSADYVWTGGFDNIRDAYVMAVYLRLFAMHPEVLPAPVQEEVPPPPVQPERPAKAVQRRRVIKRVTVKTKDNPSGLSSIARLSLFVGFTALAFELVQPGLVSGPVLRGWAQLTKPSAD